MLEREYPEHSIARKDVQFLRDYECVNNFSTSFNIKTTDFIRHYFNVVIGYRLCQLPICG